MPKMSMKFRLKILYLDNAAADQAVVLLYSFRVPLGPLFLNSFLEELFSDMRF